MEGQDDDEVMEIDAMLYDFIKHIPQYEKKNVLKSLTLKFQRRFGFCMISVAREGFCIVKYNYNV